MSKVTFERASSDDDETRLNVRLVSKRAKIDFASRFDPTAAVRLSSRRAKSARGDPFAVVDLLSGPSEGEGRC